MSRRTRIEIFVWIAALFALTGGFGLFVPGILGLGHCADFYGPRLVLILFLLFLLGVCAVYALATKCRRIGLRLGAAAALLCTSVLINALLDQDPLGASLNWQAPHLKMDPEWGSYQIANHEQLYYDEALHSFVAEHGGA